MRGMRRLANAWDDCANTRIPRYARGMRGMRDARPASASVRGQAPAACVPACRYYLSPRRTGCTCLALMHLHRDSMPSKLKVNDGFRRIPSARAQERKIAALVGIRRRRPEAALAVRPDDRVVYGTRQPMPRHICQGSPPAYGGSRIYPCRAVRLIPMDRSRDLPTPHRRSETRAGSACHDACRGAPRGARRRRRDRARPAGPCQGVSAVPARLRRP
jgi:hypothetical protein